MPDPTLDPHRQQWIVRIANHSSARHPNAHRTVTGALRCGSGARPTSFVAVDGTTTVFQSGDWITITALFHPDDPGPDAGAWRALLLGEIDHREFRRQVRPLSPSAPIKEIARVRT